MILLSLNIRGVGGPVKVASFRRLLSHSTPDIIFLQETLVNNKKARSFLNLFHSNWHICTVSSLGTSGGLVVAWDPTKYDFSSYLCCGGILLSGIFRLNKKRINLINVYSPCSDKHNFGKKLQIRVFLTWKI
jgi:exonuclease III